jgi:hypothetical protein
MTSSAAVRIGVGTRLVHDGELVQIVETRSGQMGMYVTVKNTSTQVLIRSSLHDLLMSEGTRVIADSDGPCSSDDVDVAAVILAQLSDIERQSVVERAAHMREILTGFRSGSEEFAAPGEPRAEYRADRGQDAADQRRPRLCRHCPIISGYLFEATTTFSSKVYIRYRTMQNSLSSGSLRTTTVPSGYS